MSKNEQVSSTNPIVEVLNGLTKLLTVGITVLVKNGLPFAWKCLVVMCRWFKFGGAREFFGGGWRNWLNLDQWKGLLIKKHKNSIISERDLQRKVIVTENTDATGTCLLTNETILSSSYDLSRNSLVIGSSGWGKSYLLKILGEHQIKNNLPLVFIDPKGSLEELNGFRKMCTFYKRKFYVFSDNYMGPESKCFNPIRDLSDDKIVTVIMRSLNWDGTPAYFRSLAEGTLFNILEEITKKEEVPSLPLINRYLQNDYLENKDVAGLVSQMKSICQTALGKRLNDHFSNPAITMEDAIKNGYCLYIGLSTQSYGSIARTLGKVFTNEILQTSAKRNSESVDPRNEYQPFTVFIDEAGSVVEPDFLDLINKSRSSGIQILCAVQSFHDFDRGMPNLRLPLMECFSNFFLFRQTPNESTEALGKIIGTMKDMKETKQTNDELETGGGSKRVVDKYICHPNLLRDISLGRMISVQLGKKKIVRALAVRDFGKSPANLLNIKEPIIEKMKRNYKTPGENRCLVDVPDKDKENIVYGPAQRPMNFNIDLIKNGKKIGQPLKF